MRCVSVLILYFFFFFFFFFFGEALRNRVSILLKNILIFSDAYPLNVSLKGVSVGFGDGFCRTV